MRKKRDKIGLVIIFNEEKLNNALMVSSGVVTRVLIVGMFHAVPTRKA